MIDPNPPLRSVRSPNHQVASADQLATTAGVSTFAKGGNAVDAAIATNAAIAVTGPHLCGLGGDLFALVVLDDGDEAEVFGLNASGRAGSGADSAAMRAQGLDSMPFRHDIRSVTVPGCVDGWIALHERFGSLPLSDCLAPAIDLARNGFPASPLLARSVQMLEPRSAESLSELAQQATQRGRRVRRPGVADALEAIAVSGREGFYAGTFGAGLVELGDGLYSEADLAQNQADWVDPLSADAFGVRLHTIGPNSQGYLALGSSVLAERLDLPSDPDDERWAHLLIEASIAAGRDRTEALHEAADGDALVAAIAARRAEIGTERATVRSVPIADGDTTYLCTAGVGSDGRRMAVSLIQSNAAGFGSHLVEPNTGVNLHNRGMGFSLESGHSAELGPGRRPPHTLLPMAATGLDGRLAGVFGTMGGDAQPQIMLQVAARLFHHRQTPARALGAGRWALKGPETGFDTWTAPQGPIVAIEGQAPDGWAAALAERGHRTATTPPWDSGFGHACAILAGRDGMWVGSGDPRTVIGTCAGG